MIRGSRAKARSQYPSVMTATSGASIRSSSVVSRRPAAGTSPIASKNAPVTKAPCVLRTLSGGPASNVNVLNPPTPSNTSRWSASARTTGYESESLNCDSRASPGVMEIWSNCPALGTGKERSSSASIKVKIAVFAPMPSDSASRATAAKLGLFRSVRSAYRTSWRTCSCHDHLHAARLSSCTSEMLPNAIRA